MSGERRNPFLELVLGSLAGAVWNVTPRGVHTQGGHTETHEDGQDPPEKKRAFHSDFKIKSPYFVNIFVFFERFRESPTGSLASQNEKLCQHRETFECFSVSLLFLPTKKNLKKES